MTYTYGCDGCGARFEREQRITDAPIKTCPCCGKQRAKRLIEGGSGFVLKGGGWAAQGYR